MDSFIGDLNIPSPPSENSPRKVPSCAKYAVDMNLFRLESSTLTRAKWATSRNNVATDKRGEDFPGGSIPKTVLSWTVLSTDSLEGIFKILLRNANVMPLDTTQLCMQMIAETVLVNQSETKPFNWFPPTIVAYGEWHLVQSSLRTRKIQLVRILNDIYSNI